MKIKHKRSPATIRIIDLLVLLAGLAANARAGLTLSPTSLTFGAQPVGTTSPTQAVTISNNTSGTVTINSIATSANFSQTNTCIASPTFSDSFNTGTLDTSKWVIDTGGAPGNSSTNTSSFSASYISLSQGMLAMKLTQTGTSSAVTSIGAELRSIQTFGYGTYDWVFRAASPATTPTGTGTAVSGSDSGGFSFINNSQTEIDWEYEGQFPHQLEMTNWNTTSLKQYTSTTVATADTAFHDYRFIWSPGQILFYVDGRLVSTHTQNIPTAPAYIMANIWGTNSTSFGGLATLGVTRYLYISRITYSPSTTPTGSLASGQSCTVNAAFSPTLTGPITGALSISDSASTTAQTVPMTGTGVTPVVPPAKPEGLGFQ